MSEGGTGFMWTVHKRVSVSACRVSVYARVWAWMSRLSGVNNTFESRWGYNRNRPLTCNDTGQGPTSFRYVHSLSTSMREHQSMTAVHESPSTEKGGLPVGPIIDDACDLYGDCKRPRSEHREGFMDLRDGVIDHDFVEPRPRPYDHERVPAMITTEWRCHSCGADNDVWGTGATEGYMECGSCGAWSWLDFDPDGYEALTDPFATRITSPSAPRG